MKLVLVSILVISDSKMLNSLTTISLLDKFDCKNEANLSIDPNRYNLVLHGIHSFNLSNDARTSNALTKMWLFTEKSPSAPTTFLQTH
jgi:hypothetical protein